MGLAKQSNQLSEKELAKLPIVGRQPESEKEAAYLNEICDFEFYNIEQPGVLLKFPYGSTKKQHNFTFFHGARYRIPRHVARHVESRSTPIKAFKPVVAPQGHPQMAAATVGEKPRFQMRMVFEGGK